MALRPRFVGDPDFLDPLLASAAFAPIMGRQADCDICGLVEAGCFGFGSFRNGRGIWACQDIDCRAEAETRWRAAGRTLEAAE